MHISFLFEPPHSAMFISRRIVLVVVEAMGAAGIEGHKV